MFQTFCHKKVALALLLILASFFVFCNLQTFTTPLPAYGEETSSVSEDSTVVSENSEDSEEDDSDEDDSGLILWIADLISKLDTVIEGLQTLFKDGFFSAFGKMIGYLMDGLVELVEQSFADSFIYTKSISNFAWIHSIWSVSLILGIGICGISLLLLGYRYMSGHGDGLWKPVIYAILLSIFSLYITEITITAQNKSWGEIYQAPIQEMYTAVGKSWDGDLGNLDPNIVLKILVTGNNLQGQNINEFESKSLSQVLYDPGRGDGGKEFILMFGTMLAIFLIGAVNILRMWVLALTTIVCPLYMAFSSLFGKLEPVLGAWNIILRSSFLQSLMALSFWLIYSVMAASVSGPALGGASPALVAMILLWILVFVTYTWWLKAIRNAVKSPLTLGGGTVAATIGKGGEVVAGSTKALADRYGLGSVSKVAGDLEERSGKIHQWGKTKLDSQDFQGKTIVKTISKAAEKITPRKKYSSKVQKVIPDRTWSPPSDSNMSDWRAYSFPVGANPSEIDNALRRSNIPNQAYTVDSNNNRILVHVQYADQAQQTAERALSSNPPYWTSGGKYLVLINGRPTVVENPPPGGVDMGKWKGIP